MVHPLQYHVSKAQPRPRTCFTNIFFGKKSYPCHHGTLPRVPSYRSLTHPLLLLSLRDPPALGAIRPAVLELLLPRPVSPCVSTRKAR